MAVKANLKVEGVENLVRKIARIKDAVTAENTLVQAMEDAAEPMRATAEGLAPRRSGDLARNIKVVRVPGRAEVAVVADRFYSHMQEFGTRHHPAQPFMRPAYDQERGAAIRRVRSDLESVIRRASQ